MHREWRPAVGFEGFYEVSNDGLVRSVARVVIRRDGKPMPVKQQIMKQVLSNAGYVRVSMSKDGWKGWKSVHRLVAESFIANPENKREVNHKDGDKMNNAVDNLEWVTSKENAAHRNATGLWRKPDLTGYIERHKRKVIVDGEHVFNSITEAAEFIGSTESQVCQTARGNYKTTNGHTVEYYEEVA